LDHSSKKARRRIYGTDIVHQAKLYGPLIAPKGGSPRGAPITNEFSRTPCWNREDQIRRDRNKIVDEDNENDNDNYNDTVTTKRQHLSFPVIKKATQHQQGPPPCRLQLSCYYYYYLSLSL
jgi:hypothetical protein